MHRKISLALLISLLSVTPVWAQAVVDPNAEALGDVPLGNGPTYNNAGITPNINDLGLGSTGINIPGTDVPIESLVDLLDGTAGDRLLSVNASSIQGIFNNSLSDAFSKAADRVNGAFNPAAALLGYGNKALLQAGVSIDKRAKAGIGIPDDVAQEIFADVRERFGEFAEEGRVANNMLSKAAIDAETVGLYSDKEGPDGIEYGFLTKKGAQQREDLLKSLNKGLKALKDKESNVQQKQLTEAGTNLNAAGQAENKVQGLADATKAKVDAAAAKAESAQSTQFAVKAAAELLQGLGTGLLDIEKAQSAANVLDKKARFAQIQAAKIESQKQMHMANSLNELNKSLSSQKEEAKLTRNAINRNTNQLLKESDREDFYNAYAANGVVEAQGLTGLPDFSRSANTGGGK
jgi:nucleoid-associated protein YgaU